MMWHATREVARKELLQMLRSKRLLGVGITTFVAMILVSLVLPLILFNIRDFLDAFVGEGAGFSDLSSVPYIHNGILLFFLEGIFILSGYFLFQLAPIILASDAVASEWKNRTIFLLLSKPVPRPAMVLGKFIGITLPLAAMTAVLMLLDYLIIVAVFPGFPNAEEWGRFFGAIGIVALGVLSFGALSLFFSTITRSGVVSMLLTILTWIVILPLLSNIAFFIALFEGSFDVLDSGEAMWSHYLSPARMMESASPVLAPELGFLTNFFGGIGGNAEWWAACLTLLGHTMVYLLAAVFVVQFRNFE